MTTANRDSPPAVAFRHEALFYRDRAAYLAGTEPFIQAGLDAGEPVLVAVPEPNIHLLRDGLGQRSAGVRFVDMVVAGANPGCIIPKVLYGFLAGHPGQPVRIVGEPIHRGRSPVEYPACVQHEALINLAFAGTRAVILCPYDASGLGAGVLADAAATHPFVVDDAGRRRSGHYTDPEDVVDAFNRPLPDPPGWATTLRVCSESLSAARRMVADHGRAAGIDTARIADLQLAVNEVATNSLAHRRAGDTAGLARQREPGLPGRGSRLAGRPARRPAATVRRRRARARPVPRQPPL